MNATLNQLTLFVGVITTLAGALVAFLKFGPQKRDMLVRTTDALIVTQNRVIDELQDQIDRIRADLNEQIGNISMLRAQLKDVTDERNRLRRENRELRSRVDLLEAELADLKQHGHQ